MEINYSIVFLTDAIKIRASQFLLIPIINYKLRFLNGVPLSCKYYLIQILLIDFIHTIPFLLFR